AGDSLPPKKFGRPIAFSVIVQNECRSTQKHYIWIGRSRAPQQIDSLARILSRDRESCRL
ncbi:hypothetical protein QIG23_27965, partial [Klebsiella pneumoniae]|nr:hypothetical protein [Klebsiella pneumoniae]